MPTITKNSIKWDANDWLGGLLPHAELATARNRLIGNGFTAQNCDPLRNPGYILPGYAFTDLGNVAQVTDVIKNGAIGDNRTGYCISNDAKIFEIDTNANNISTTSPYPYSISGSSLVGKDIIVYNIGTTKYIFYSWYAQASTGDVGRLTLGSDTFDDDFLSTVPSGADTLDRDTPLPMIVGDDDILYIGNGRNLHAFDGQTGANGTLSKNVLQLPLEYVITSYSKTNNFLVIYAYKSSNGSYDNPQSEDKTECKAFFWDYLSTDPTFVYDLPGNYVNGGFQYKGTIGCFVEGNSMDIYTDRPGKLIIFDGEKFDEVRAFETEIPGHGGVESRGNVIYWNSAGDIYRFGSPYTGIGDNTLNRIGESDGNSSRGMLKIMKDNKIFVSNGAGAGNDGLSRFNSGLADNAFFITPLVAVLPTRQQKARIRAVKYVLDSSPADPGDLTLKLLIDRKQNGSSTGNESVVLNNFLPTQNKFEYIITEDTSDNPLPNFSEIGIEFMWDVNSGNTPGIESIELFWEPFNINP